MNDTMYRELEAEFNARYDDDKERYAATIADMLAFAQIEEWAAEEEYRAWIQTPEGQAAEAAMVAAEAAEVAAREARVAADEAAGIFF